MGVYRKMKSSTAAVLLKIAILAVSAGFFFVFYIIFFAVQSSGHAFPEFSTLVLPCEIAVVVSAIPCYAALVLFWRICSRIAKGEAYSRKNANALGIVAKLAAGDTALCFAITVCLRITGAYNGGTLFISLLIVIAGAAIVVLAAALAKAVGKLANSRNETTPEPVRESNRQDALTHQ
jgi:hypothetical protein